MIKVNIKIFGQWHSRYLNLSQFIEWLAITPKNIKIKPKGYTTEFYKDDELVATAIVATNEILMSMN